MIFKKILNEISNVMLYQYLIKQLILIDIDK